LQHEKTRRKKNSRFDHITPLGTEEEYSSEEHPDYEGKEEPRSDETD